MEDVADWTYLNAQYFITIGRALLHNLRRNDSFYFLRKCP